MAIELKELAKLTEKVKDVDMSLVAGEGGMTNFVTWVHMAENEEASAFLDAGHLVIITGVGLTSEGNILNLIKAFYEKRVSGVIINIGPFIETIPKEALSFCNDNNLPLFVVPWKAHLANIMHLFCSAITREEQRMMGTSAAFKNAIFFPKQEELYVVPLSQRSFRVKWNYSVTVMKVKAKEKVTQERLATLCWSIDKNLRRNTENFAVFVSESDIILVLANITEEYLIDKVNDVRAHVKQILKKGENLYMGVGRLTKSIRCIYKSYNQAKSIRRLQSRGKIGEDNFYYNNLGIYRLLMGIEDRDLMKEYYNHTLKALKDYDTLNGADLCTTLRCYLSHDGSVKDTADELFVHRNTINYKLNKIEELLGIEMSSLAARTELMLAFNLQDIL